MRQSMPWLLAVAGALSLLVVILGIWGWSTIPPAPDPETLPSQAVEPPSAAYRDAVEEGRSAARTRLAEEKLPGLSLAVAVDGEIVWAEGFRWANLEQEIPVTPGTRFRIGGISQSLTAAAVGLLVDRGRLDLDVPVQRYVPGFPEKEWPISIRQLMAHTAGIRPYRGEGGIFRGTCADEADRLAVFADDPLRFRPGTEVAYSTCGWVLVGAAVAAAAGEPYLDFLQHGIFEPLGMENTGFDRPGQAEAGDAHFYYPRLMLNPRYGLQNAPAVDLSCHLPAVGFLSTPSDLVRFGSAMMGDGLLEPGTIAELLTPIGIASGDSTDQGLGWTVHRIPLGATGTPRRVVSQGLGPAVVRHTLGVENAGGQVAGSTASLLLVPDYRLAIAVATNVSGSGSVSELAVRLADILVGNLEGQR